ncbi:Kelch repeat-containing protein [Streptomyces naphthomycinicus]|uniref:Kelch repeat-containing protein n=1 Tax=Streptomyces naphthomycinicus TaxID=2872625 RepID=UPI001CEC6573|nr:kelch repeat-containing protein [Streptomyces sp. TML10]
MTRSSALIGGGRPAAAGPATGAWTPAGELPTARQWPSAEESAVLLDDGTVLAAGGAVVRGTATAECLLFQPRTGAWEPTGNLTEPRFLHSLTKLENGHVLAVGGVPQTDRLPFRFLDSAEVYDPAARTWTPVPGKLSTGRSTHTATLLPDGTVLVAGGEGVRSPGAVRPLRSAELFRPATGGWTPAEPMTDPRLDHRAVRLPDGRVLVVGGNTATAGPAPVGQAFCELYDPVAGTWSPTGSLRLPRSGHQATLLTDGSVLVTGGAGLGARKARGHTPGSQWRTERYNPAAGTWTPAGNMPAGRNFHRALLLPSGRVLVLGGADSATYDAGYAQAALYDPRSRVWLRAGGLRTGRFYCSATLLADGRVLAAGGTVRAGAADPGYGRDLLTATSEIFTE